LEADGTEELYVADDNSGAIKRYAFENGSYVSKTINRRAVPGQAMVWNITQALL
jgi:hypothetical protein